MGSRKEDRHERSKKDKKKRKQRSRSKEREHKRHRHHHRHKKHYRERENRSPDSHVSSLSNSDVSLSDNEVVDRSNLELIKQKLNSESHSKIEAKRLDKEKYYEKYEKEGKYLEKEVRYSDKESKAYEKDSKYSENDSTSENKSGKEGSLSIEDTNRIRLKLGLKPLQVETKKLENVISESTSSKTDLSEQKLEDGSVHKPPENIRDKIQIEKLREKIAVQREKRLLKEKMAAVKILGDSDSDDGSAFAWINKSRKLQKEKEEAEKRAKMLEELDAEFGVGDLIEQEKIEQKKKAYAENNLSGLKVEHDVTRFEEGKATVLTLKDSNVLDEEEDTLINVNIIDSEIAEKNIFNRTRKVEIPEYEVPEIDDFGNFVQKTLLTKYDEEIEGQRKKTFRLGKGGITSSNQSEEDFERHKRERKLRKLQTLETPASQLATEYMTTEDLKVVFKKKKKKKKRVLTAADLLTIGGDIGSAEEHFGKRIGEEGTASSLKKLTEDDAVAIKMEVDEMPLDDKKEEDEEKEAVELHAARLRAKRAKFSFIGKSENGEYDPIQALTDDSEVVPKKKRKREEAEDALDDDPMVLNTTDEFCRTLGDIPTYGQSGNRATGREETANVPVAASPTRVGAWEEVLEIEETPVEIAPKTLPILEEEPDASKGVANALRIATQKGYLDKSNTRKSGSGGLQHLKAVNYSIEDKTLEDDRRIGRERYCGPIIDFREKDGYRPDVKLEYVDDIGRKLSAKEAFRYLSHKFHGKGSGKNKTEKRMKKFQEELLMRHMSSSDTPLKTLEKQQEKQKQMGSAYLIISGPKNQDLLDVKK